MTNKHSEGVLKAHTPVYKIFDCKTKSYLKNEYQTFKNANRVSERMDMQYGATRYSVKKWENSNVVF